MCKVYSHILITILRKEKKAFTSSRVAGILFVSIIQGWEEVGLQLSVCETEFTLVLLLLIVALLYCINYTLTLPTPVCVSCAGSSKHRHSFQTK